MSDAAINKPRAVETFSTLAPDEQRLIDAYRTMDDFCKAVTRRQAESKATRYPTPAPRMRLVMGGRA